MGGGRQALLVWIHSEKVSVLYVESICPAWMSNVTTKMIQSSGYEEMYRVFRSQKRGWVHFEANELTTVTAMSGKRVSSEQQWCVD